MTVAYLWNFLKHKDDDEHSHLKYQPSTGTFKTWEGGNLGKTLVRFEKRWISKIIKDHRMV